MNRVKNTKPPTSSFLLPAESAEQYEADRRKIENAIEPADGIEEIFCEDVVYSRQQMGGCSVGVLRYSKPHTPKLCIPS